MNRMNDSAPQVVRHNYDGINRIRLVCPPLEGDDDSFRSWFSFNLVLGALNNLLDNALYWLRVRWPELPADHDPAERMLYIDVSRDFEASPAIVVADSGPGGTGRRTLRSRSSRASRTAWAWVCTMRR